MTPETLRLTIILLALCASMLMFAWIGRLAENSVTSEIAVQPDTPAQALHELPGERRPATKRTWLTGEDAERALLSDRVIGRVTDEQGKGLGGIKLRIRTLRGANRKFVLRQAVTDASGNFLLGDLDPQAVYMLYTEAAADYPGYRLEAFTLDRLPTPFEIRLARLKLVDVVGTVVDAEHAPIPNFTVTIDSLDAEYPSRTVTSDASGQFRLDAFPVGELKIYTAAPEYFRILGLRASADEYRNLTLVFDRGNYRLEGRVLDRHGLPVAPARVTLNSVITGYEYRSQASRTSLTDASGGFGFSGLGSGAHTLGVYAVGYKPHIEYHEFQSFTDRIVIRLSP